MNADTSSNTLIVVGCSAGGFDALMRLLPAIPAEARCAFAVVLHLLPEPGNKLVEIFASHCREIAESWRWESSGGRLLAS